MTERSAQAGRVWVSLAAVAPSGQLPGSGQMARVESLGKQEPFDSNP